LIQQGEYSSADMQQLSAAHIAVRDLRSVDSTMSKKILDNIKHMSGRASRLLAGEVDPKAAKVWGVALSRLISYLDKQMSVCHGKVAGKVAAQRSFNFFKRAATDPPRKKGDPVIIWKTAEGRTNFGNKPIRIPVGTEGVFVMKSEGETPDDPSSALIDQGGADYGDDWYDYEGPRYLIKFKGFGKVWVKKDEFLKGKIIRILTGEELANLRVSEVKDILTRYAGHTGIPRTWINSTKLMKKLKTEAPAMYEYVVSGSGDHPGSGGLPRYANFDPRNIGKIKRPSGDPDEMRIVKDTDQRWFSEVQDLYPSSDPVWDGHGVPPKGDARVRKLAARVLVDKLATRWVAAQRG